MFVEFLKHGNELREENIFKCKHFFVFTIFNNLLTFAFKFFRIYMSMIKTISEFINDMCKYSRPRLVVDSRVSRARFRVVDAPGPESQFSGNK